MRDPMTLARSIYSPFPKVSLRPNTPANDARGWFKWTFRPFGKHSYISPFIYVGKYVLYFHSIIDIWHKDPLGDVGPACHGRKYWKWHIHHLSVRFTFWYRFVQRHITKCAWCGEKSNKEKGLVNHSTGFMVCHADCLSKYIKSMHSHDPATCWNCTHKKSQ